MLCPAILSDRTRYSRNKSGAALPRCANLRQHRLDEAVERRFDGGGQTLAERDLARFDAEDDGRRQADPGRLGQPDGFNHRQVVGRAPRRSLGRLLQERFERETVDRARLGAGLNGVDQDDALGPLQVADDGQEVGPGVDDLDGLRQVAAREPFDGLRPKALIPRQRIADPDNDDSRPPRPPARKPPRKGGVRPFYAGLQGPAKRMFRMSGSQPPPVGAACALLTATRRGARLPRASCRAEPAPALRIPLTQVPMAACQGSGMGLRRRAVRAENKGAAHARDVSVALGPQTRPPFARPQGRDTWGLGRLDAELAVRAVALEPGQGKGKTFLVRRQSLLRRFRPARGAGPSIVIAVEAGRRYNAGGKAKNLRHQQGAPP